MSRIIDFLVRRPHRRAPEPSVDKVVDRILAQLALDEQIILARLLAKESSGQQGITP